MRYLAKVEVRLKTGFSDPEGDAARRSLKGLQYQVEAVNVSKVYRIILGAASMEDAKMISDEMCRRLLANPIRDNYDIQIEESG